MATLKHLNSGHSCVRFLNSFYLVFQDLGLMYEYAILNS